MTCEFNAQIARMKSACFVDRIILLDAAVRCLLCSATDFSYWSTSEGEIMLDGWDKETDLSWICRPFRRSKWPEYQWAKWQRRRRRRRCSRFDHIEDIINGIRWQKLCIHIKAAITSNATLPLCVYASRSRHIYLYMPDRFDFIIKSDYFEIPNVHTLQWSSHTKYKYLILLSSSLAWLNKRSLELLCSFALISLYCSFRSGAEHHFDLNQLHGKSSQKWFHN